MQQFALPILLAALIIGLSTPSCKHEPLLTGDPNPTDTTQNPGGPGTGPNGNNGSGILCDPDSVYFQNQILPLLVSNCTESGCHNAADRQEGVVLVSYQTLLSTVEHVTDNNWGENKLMRVLLDSDPDDRMPYGKPPLSQDQINLIGKWVQQGAKNNGCNENYGACETTNVQYSVFVQPLIQARCQGCHSGSNPQGGINLASYANVKQQVQNGKLLDVLTRTSNWMPKGGAKLDDCTIAKLQSWINAGAQDN